jgi:hypothetical protein
MCNDATLLHLIEVFLLPDVVPSEPFLWTIAVRLLYASCSTIEANKHYALSAKHTKDRAASQSKGLKPRWTQLGRMSPSSLQTASQGPKLLSIR